MRAKAWPRVPFLDATSARVTVLIIALLAACLVRDNPLVAASWLQLSGAASILLSLFGGAITAVIFVICTRIWAQRTLKGRTLARELSAKAKEMGARQILFVAASASLAEEFFFRGALVPTCGIVFASLAFGILHLKSGVAWAALAAVFGVALGVVFMASGSLVGPLLAHFAVDAIALFSARDASIDASLERHRTEKLGGLLGAMHESSKDRLC
jgi:membrane protease YdiL (CAAX protease family)